MGLNSTMTRFKQKYDSTLMTTDEKITDDVQQLEIAISQLTDMLRKN